MCAFLSYVTASNYFGFGVMDAKKMVEFAKVWPERVPRRFTPSEQVGHMLAQFQHILVTGWPRIAHSFNTYWSQVDTY